jgi:hypothetical protein
MTIDFLIKKKLLIVLEKKNRILTRRRLSLSFFYIIGIMRKISNFDLL